MNEIAKTLWTGLMMASAVILLAIALIFKFREWRIHPLRATLRIVRRPWLERLLVLFFICGVIHYGATKGTRQGGDEERREDPNVQRTDSSGTRSEDATNFPSAFRIVAVSLSNDCFNVETAWSNGLFTAGTTLDYLVKTNLLDAAWSWDGSEVVDEGTTGVVHVVDLDDYATTVIGPDDLLGRIPPKMLFVRVVPRLPPDDLRDSDGDGLPDMYEFHNGTNPWIPDYGLASHLVQVDPQTNLQSVVDGSVAYSVIEIQPGIYTDPGWGQIVLPEHPILLTGGNGLPVIRGSGFAAFLLPSNTTERTIIRDLYIDRADDGLQVGFWCGGNLPWVRRSASATFENVHLRFSSPRSSCYGWIFYGASSNHSTISRCTVNARGASRVRGVYAVDPPPLDIGHSTFLGFPSSTATNTGVALLLETMPSVNATNEAPVRIHDCVFDASFTNAEIVARIGQPSNSCVRIENSIVPRKLPDGILDATVALCITNAGVTAWGFPMAGSPAGDLGVGALTVLDPTDAHDEDGDGLTDWMEAYHHATSPLLWDSDGDGIGDGDEIMVGTDPMNARSFIQTLTVTITNVYEMSSATNFVSWGFSPEGWETNEVLMVTGGGGTVVYSNASTVGATYLKSFYDLDRDGCYSADKDILLVKDIPMTLSEARLSFVFGDVDGDGVADVMEVFDGTNPYDPHNFRFRATIEAVNEDMGTCTSNYVAVSDSPGLWMPTGVITSFVGYSVSLMLDRIVTNTPLHFMCLRDLNGNGIYDEGTDLLYDMSVSGSQNGGTIVIRVGDYDQDGVSDSSEYGESTNPRDGRDYCFHLKATYNGIFMPTNGLTAVAYLGSTNNIVFGAQELVGTTLSIDFGHLSTTSGEVVKVLFWEDGDHNGLYDVGERRVLDTLRVLSHDMNVTNSLPLGDFDVDGDGMLDDWESMYGLDPRNPSDAFGDLDGDGFANLYEFMVGTCPTNSLEDGMGTVLRGVSRAVDNRIADKDPPGVLNYYIGYGSGARSRFASLADAHFAVNTNCWMNDVDISFLSIWNDDVENGYDWTHPMTAISPWHVMTATHVVPTNGTSFAFQTPDGTTVVRRLVAQRAIRGLSADDWTIGLLDSPLPSSIQPARFLPANYHEYIGSGRGLPVVRIGREKGCHIQDLIYLAPNRYTSGMSRVKYSEDIWRSRYSRGPWAHDSGNPIFLLLGNEVLYLCPTRGFYYDDYQVTGYLCSTKLELIQCVMDCLSDESGVARMPLTVFDLSQYPKLHIPGGEQ